MREAAHRFFTRAAHSLEEAFAPYLPTALPPALEAMAHVGNAEVVGPYKRAVHTGALEEQVCAGETLPVCVLVTAGRSCDAAVPPIYNHLGPCSSPSVSLQVASASALGAYAGATGAAFLPYLCGSLEALDGAVRDPSPALRLAAVRALEFMLQPARGQPAEAVVGPAGTLVGALTRCLEVRLRMLIGPA